MTKTLILLTMVAAMAVPAAGGSALAADPDCGSAKLVKSTKVKIEMCIDPAVWQSTDGTGDQEFVYISKDEKAGFAIVTETATTALPQYHDAILASAAKLSGADSIKSYDDADETINGRPWHRMHYDVAVQGATLEFLNYFYSEEGVGSAQFIFWSLPADAATTGANLAGKVMPTVTVTP